MHATLQYTVGAMTATKSQRKEREQHQERQHSRNASNSRNIPVRAEIPKNAVGNTFKAGAAATSGVCEQKYVRPAVEKTAKMNTTATIPAIAGTENNSVDSRNRRNINCRDTSNS